MKFYGPHSERGALLTNLELRSANYIEITQKRSDKKDRYPRYT